MVGKSDFDFFPARRAKLMAKDDAHVIKTGKPIIDKIERATRVDGVDNYVSTTKIPRRDPNGKVVGLIGVTRDITSRMQLARLKDEKEQILKRLRVLEEMTKMKSEFLSVVSHELNTPLIIVKEALMLIMDGIAGEVSKRQKDLLGKSIANLERLKKMIDDLLDMSRMEKHKLVLHYSLVNFNELLMSTSEFFTKWAKEKKITLRYHLPKKQINIFIDPERINQVVANLINNAIKFTEQNGTIEARVDVLESKVRIGVFDSGVGISQEDLPRLFRKFTQVAPTNLNKHKGMGLGLSIARELVEKHGGEIWVESKIGQGTKFCFTLPRLYTEKALDDKLRKRINLLLDKRISLYLLNILIVNFKSFKNRVTVTPRQLFKDLQGIISSTLKEFCKAERERPEVVLQGYQRGEWSILFPEIKEGEAVEICEVLKGRINQYFLKRKVKGVFINFGIMSYFQKNHDPTTKHLLTNLHVKKITIGSEIRRHQRLSYRADIDVIFDKRTIKLSQSLDISPSGISFSVEKPAMDTMDISTGGISFPLNEPLRTDAIIEVVLKPPQLNKYIRLKGKIVWIKAIEETIDKEFKRYYKAGVEFINLNAAQKKQLSLLINSLKK
jgi:signal transduction histidine kinase/GGDEF domain-containing protein